MNSKPLAFVVVAAFLVWIPTASAFNITRLLGRYPNFSTFNDLLTQTRLYEQINRRQTITVLAVDNSAIGGISGRPLDTVKRILSTHVVLDYYDLQKLSDLSKKSTLLTTLYQASGVAQNQQGFLNITKKSSGDVVFGSAVKGSSLDSTLVQQIATQPYNISVLQVSSPIIMPGLDGSMGNAATAPSSSPPAALPKEAPAEAPAVEAPAAEAPAVEAPADAPAVEAPADAPAAEGPAPASSEPADAEKKSSSTREASSLSLVVVLAFVALLW